MNCKMKTPKYKISPKGKRKLDYPQKKSRSSVKLPLIGKNIYLDVKENKHVKQLQCDLKRLGATLEEFVSRDINYLITTQPRPKNKGQSCHGEESPAASPFNCEPSPSPLNVEDRKVTSVTRGKALAEKARITTSRKTNTLLDNAEQWGVKIVSLEGAFKWIDKELKKLPKVSGNLSKIQNRAKCVSSYKTLKSPFVKFEAESYCYRPFHIELDVWPRLNVDTPRGSCPFDGTIIKGGEESREERGDLAAQVDIPSEELQNNQEETVDSGKPPTDKSCKKSDSDVTAGSRVLTAGELKRRKELKRKQDRKRGYCECCHVKYEDLDKHVKEEQHMVYVKNKANYEKLDTLICTGPNSQHFLAEYMKKSALLSVKRENKSGVSKSSGQNVSPRKSPRKSATQHVAQPYCKSPRKNHPKDTRISLSKQSESGAQTQKKVFKSPRKEREIVSKVQENIPPKTGNGGNENTPKNISKAGILEKLDKNTTITIANVVVEGSGIANDDFLSSPRKMRDRKSLTKSAESLCKGEDLLKNTLRSPVKPSPVIDKIRLSKDKQFDMNVKSTQDESNKENIKPGKIHVENDVDTSKPSRKQQNKSNEISESEKIPNESKHDVDTSKPSRKQRNKLNEISESEKIPNESKHDVDTSKPSRKQRNKLNEISESEKIPNESKHDVDTSKPSRKQRNKSNEISESEKIPNEGKQSDKNCKNIDDVSTPYNYMSPKVNEDSGRNEVFEKSGDIDVNKDLTENKLCMNNSVLVKGCLDEIVKLGRQRICNEASSDDFEVCFARFSQNEELPETHFKNQPNKSDKSFDSMIKNWENHDIDKSPCKKITWSTRKNKPLHSVISDQAKTATEMIEKEQQECEMPDSKVDKNSSENPDAKVDVHDTDTVTRDTRNRPEEKDVNEKTHQEQSGVTSNHETYYEKVNADEKRNTHSSQQKMLHSRNSLEQNKKESMDYKTMENGDFMFEELSDSEIQFVTFTKTLAERIKERSMGRRSSVKSYNLNELFSPVLDQPSLASKNDQSDQLNKQKLVSEKKLVRKKSGSCIASAKVVNKYRNHRHGNSVSMGENIPKGYQGDDEYERTPGTYKSKISSKLKQKKQKTKFWHYVVDKPRVENKEQLKDLPKELRLLKDGLDIDVSELNCRTRTQKKQDEDGNLSSACEDVVKASSGIKRRVKTFCHYKPVAESNDSDQQGNFKDLPKELRLLKNGLDIDISDVTCSRHARRSQNEDGNISIASGSEQVVEGNSDIKKGGKKFWHYEPVAESNDSDQKDMFKDLPKELSVLKQSSLGFQSDPDNGKRRSRSFAIKSGMADSNSEYDTKTVRNKRAGSNETNKSRMEQEETRTNSDDSINALNKKNTSHKKKSFWHYVAVSSESDTDKDNESDKNLPKELRELKGPLGWVNTEVKSRRHSRTPVRANEGQNSHTDCEKDVAHNETKRTNKKSKNFKQANHVNKSDVSVNHKVAAMKTVKSVREIDHRVEEVHTDTDEIKDKQKTSKPVRSIQERLLPTECLETSRRKPSTNKCFEQHQTFVYKIRKKDTNISYAESDVDNSDDFIDEADAYDTNGKKVIGSGNETNNGKLLQKETVINSDDCTNTINKKNTSKKKRSFWHYVTVPLESDTDKDNESDKNLPKELRELKGPLGLFNTEVKSRRHSRTPVRANESQDSHTDCEKDVAHNGTKRTDKKSKNFKQANHVNKSDVAVNHKVAAMKTVKSVREIDHCVEEVHTDTDEDKDKQKTSKPVRSIQERLLPTECLETSRRKPSTKKCSEQHQTVVYKIRERGTNISYAESDVDNSDDFIDEADAYDTNGKNVSGSGNETNNRGLLQKETVINSDDCTNTINKKNRSQKKKSFWHYVTVPLESDTDKDNESDKNLPKELRELKGPLGWFNTEVKSRRHSRTPVRANEIEDSHTDCEKDVAHKEYNRSNENDEGPNSELKKNIYGSDESDTDEEKEMQQVPKWVRKLQEECNLSEALGRSRRKSNKGRYSEQYQTCAYEIRKKETNISYAEIDTDNSDDFIDETNTYDYNDKKLKPKVHEVASSYNVAQEQMLGNRKYELHEKNESNRNAPKKDSLDDATGTNKRKKFWVYVAEPDGESDEDSALDNMPKELRQLKLWKMKSDIVHGSRSERQEKNKVLNEREISKIVNQNGGSEQCRLPLSKELPVTDSEIVMDKTACGFKEESEHCRPKAKKRKVYWEYEIPSDGEDEAPKTLDKSLPKALRNLKDSWNDVSGEKTRHTRRVSSCIRVSDSGKALRNRNETVEQTGSNFDEEDTNNAHLVNENNSVEEDKLRYDERSKSPVFNRHQSNKSDVRKRRGSPVFKKSPKSHLYNAKLANKVKCDQNCQNDSDVVNELCPDSDDEVSDIIDEIQDSVKLQGSLREIEQAGSGYSRTSRQSRRKEWKRKIKELGCKASDDLQDYKRRKLDGQSDNVADSKLEQKFKSPRRRLLTNDVYYSDKDNDVFESLVDISATSLVGCQEEKEYDLTWKPVMIQDSERVQNESCSMLNKSLSNEMDIISEFDVQNTRNSARTFKSNTAKDTVSADCNSKQEKVVEINEKDSGKAEEDLEQFVPAISSPGGHSNSSWNGAVDEYLDNSVKNGQDVSFKGCSSSFYNSFHGSPYKSPSKCVSSSPFKASLLNSASKMKSPSKNCLRTPDKTHSSTPTSSPMVRKVDDDIEFNFGSPQKDRTDYSNLRSVKGVVRDMSKPVAFNLTSTPEDRKSKKHICKQD